MGPLVERGCHFLHRHARHGDDRSVFSSQCCAGARLCSQKRQPRKHLGALLGSQESAEYRKLGVALTEAQHGRSLPSVTPVLGDPTPSSGLRGHGTHVVHRHMPVKHSYT